MARKKRNHPSTQAEDIDLLFFTPVPLIRVHKRGWTAEVQIAFIHALSNCGIVSAAAKSVGRSPRSAYQLRERPGAESFAEAWDWAIEIGIEEAKFTVSRMQFDPTPNAHLILAALGMERRRNNTLPHRMRMSDRQSQRDADERWGGSLDLGAVDLPWFDRTAIQRGPAAVVQACKEARRIEREGADFYTALDAPYGARGNGAGPPPGTPSPFPILPPHPRAHSNDHVHAAFVEALERSLRTTPVGAPRDTGHDTHAAGHGPGRVPAPSPTAASRGKGRHAASAAEGCGSSPGARACNASIGAARGDACSASNGPAPSSSAISSGNSRRTGRNACSTSDGLAPSPGTLSSGAPRGTGSDACSTSDRFAPSPGALPSSAPRATGSDACSINDSLAPSYSASPFDAPHETARNAASFANDPARNATAPALRPSRGPRITTF